MLNFADDIPVLLASKIPVLVYHGEDDFICNWYGGQKWVTDLEWPGQSAFHAAKNTTWTVDGEEAGSYKSAQGLTFLRIKDAGHMVPKDQPKNALSMINNFIKTGSPAGDIEV